MNEAKHEEMEKEIRQQLINELTSICSSGIAEEMKKEVILLINKLKTSDSLIKITDSNDPIVQIFIGMSTNKKLSMEFEALLHIIRVLTEFDLLEGEACKKVFSVIDSILYTAPENFCLKVIQVAFASFSSTSLSIDSRIAAAKWIFKLSSSKSLIVKQVASGAIHQMIDIIIEQAMQGKNEINNIEEICFSDNEIVDLFSSESSSDYSDNFLSQDDARDENYWAVSLIFIILNDLTLSILGRKNEVFNDSFNGIDDLFALIKYILDQYMPFLMLFEAKYQKIISNLIIYSNLHKDDLQFIPNIILSSYKTDPKQAKPFVDALCSLTKTNSKAFNTIGAIFVSKPDICFDIFGDNNLVEISTQACRYFLMNWRGVLSYSVSIFGKRKMCFSDFDNDNDDFILVSCVVILFMQIKMCEKHQKHIDLIFDSFDTIWQRIVTTTEDPFTLSTTLKVARTAINIYISKGDLDPVNRILSTLCGISLPYPNAMSLGFKESVVLHSIIRILEKHTKNLANFWPFMLETISKCFFVASHKRTDTDLRALGLITPSLLDFSTNLSNEYFKKLFDLVLELSKSEAADALKNNIDDPNLWPLKTLCSLYISNLSRTDAVEAKFFEHLIDLLHCSSKELRKCATHTIYDVAKTSVDCKEATQSCRRKIFDLILTATNSEFKDVSLTAFSSFLPLLAGGTAGRIDSEWMIILTILKAVWTGEFEENKETCFRILNFICRDCLRFIDINWIEMLLSTLNAYILQRGDINTALCAVNLFWDIATGIIPISTDDHIRVWKSLFRTLQMNFRDCRQNVRIATLGTFFNIVSTYKPRFPENLQAFVVSSVFQPLFNTILKEVNDSSRTSFDVDVYLLALQNGIQCLHSLGNYEDVMPIIVLIIENLSQRAPMPNTATETMKCFMQLASISDKNLLNEITFSIHRIISSFLANHKIVFMQGAATVVNDIFAIVANDLDDDQFRIWVSILNMFCTFQTDKPFLNVATHASLNAIASASMLSIDRLCILIRMVMRLIDIGHPPLTTKCFETLYTIYSNLFNEENRGVCLSLLLLTFQNNIEIEECSSCMQKILLLPADLTQMLKDDNNMKKIIAICKKRKELKQTVIDAISKYTNNIPADI